jgi:hypothetical protein
MNQTKAFADPRAVLTQRDETNARAHGTANFTQA